MYVCFSGPPEVKFSFWSRDLSLLEQLSRICSQDFINHMRPADDHGLYCIYPSSIVTVLPWEKEREKRIVVVIKKTCVRCCKVTLQSNNHKENSLLLLNWSNMNILDKKQYVTASQACHTVWKFPLHSVPSSHRWLGLEEWFSHTTLLLQQTSCFANFHCVSTHPVILFLATSGDFSCWTEPANRPWCKKKKLLQALIMILLLRDNG